MQYQVRDKKNTTKMKTGCLQENEKDRCNDQENYLLCSFKITLNFPKVMSPNKLFLFIRGHPRMWTICTLKNCNQ